ncbi:hypothetical protein HDE68_003412 [Pedobacter cryoconitis]|uniref:SGNH/GDSL hydrolase family protein n=1 Tax=Pedobacter cryoconitis TaxID=188932 RepID=A0A7W8ZNY1_9SPHI|nr:hypothetical protein [Pedobacter cryoconitis]MBB5637497.1 hypothetical protein [Pedobacter cryoconitis]
MNCNKDDQVIVDASIFNQIKITSTIIMKTQNKKRQIIMAGMLVGISALTYSCTKDSSPNIQPDNTLSNVNSAAGNSLRRILFVGDSFTHGRYAPVRQYKSGGDGNSANGSTFVYDENYGQGGARQELEDGPWGGIPGIFAEFAYESGLKYDVHIEAISATSLAKNFAAASDVIAQSKWNAVVLQEISVKPIPYALTNSNISNPADFCSSVQTIEKAVHGASAAAKVYLYEPWPSADLAETMSGGDPSAAGFKTNYMNSLTTLANANHNAYYSAASHDGNIAGVAPVGEAWVNAWAAKIANADPYLGSSNAPVLWYGLNSVNDPQIKKPDYHHPSIYGAYLSGLVLFQQITGVDVRTLGGQEKAANSLGIPSAIATQLQLVAWQTVTQESSQPIGQSADPCSIGSGV